MARPAAARDDRATYASFLQPSGASADISPEDRNVLAMMAKRQRFFGVVGFLTLAVVSPFLPFSGTLCAVLGAGFLVFALCEFVFKPETRTKRLIDRYQAGKAMGDGFPPRFPISCFFSKPTQLGFLAGVEAYCSRTTSSREETLGAQWLFRVACFCTGNRTVLNKMPSLWKTPAAEEAAGFGSASEGRLSDGARLKRTGGIPAARPF